MGYIWQDLYLTTDLSSAKYSVLLPVYLPDLYSVPKSFPYAKSLHRAIICNTIRFYLMYKSLYNRNIYFQILTMQNNLIPSTGWITEFKYFQISANNRICVSNDPCLRWQQFLMKVLTKTFKNTSFLIFWSKMLSYSAMNSQ